MTSFAGRMEIEMVARYFLACLAGLPLGRLVAAADVTLLNAFLRTRHASFTGFHKAFAAPIQETAERRNQQSAGGAGSHRGR